MFLGEGNKLFSFVVTGNLDDLNSEVSTFTYRLVIFLLAFGAALILASYFIVQLGFKPLRPCPRRIGESQARQDFSYQRSLPYRYSAAGR